MIQGNKKINNRTRWRLHYWMFVEIWLIAVDLSRQKESDADPQLIQQIELVGQLKELGDEGNATDASNDQYMFLLTISEKIKETRLKFSQGSVTVL